ncbi:MAG: hypothetical protein A3C15_01125 [Candidatus Magasanikbacteria bacterium RIFCSPHIGHO2_02_FULL_50_9b]|uniref:Uncharacterized protein n=1 Tax=Candidatus Magasanikbacteria bacterium RIFCSPHIGHO2_02_FULL_50_9b TaxID=1798682 RepID=A0A1F6M9J9_9BACT|nr:MAG: hypothetical protein A3C15_01125 [Candidatus Magasanikbacteria bacterium RIFCSPHIGHO2_02_FULL_50_9b]
MFMSAHAIKYSIRRPFRIIKKTIFVWFIRKFRSGECTTDKIKFVLLKLRLFGLTCGEFTNHSAA